MKETFLSNLYFLLEQNGWTMTTLSIQGDIPYNTLSGMIYCNKNMPKLETIDKIANALGVETWELFKSKEDVNSNTIVCPKCGARFKLEEESEKE